MHVKSAEFITSAVKPSQYPVGELSEIAFAGRSNVGKSSLINTLVNRKKLVKTGSTPGRTQLINFFNINKEFTFVDLPGYGYAKVPEHIRKQWAPMIETYLSTRQTLKGVVLLIDIRRTPKKEEIDLIAWLDSYNIPVQIILTKADKLSVNKRRQRPVIIAESLCLKKDNFVMFSAKSRMGLKKLWNEIERLLDNRHGE
ncbi:MAG: YihA family ribosome biogenesis GTP-binding protein [Desulfobacteraceae bacterium 4572_19]|nr:MAG: YihA family ribosome biogenesis GTP-binding protein [Desulfobacteraceae bacterium 4572_19]